MGLGRQGRDSATIGPRAFFPAITPAQKPCGVRWMRGLPFRRAQFQQRLALRPPPARYNWRPLGGCFPCRFLGCRRCRLRAACLRFRAPIAACRRRFAARCSPRRAVAPSPVRRVCAGGRAPGGPAGGRRAPVPPRSPPVAACRRCPPPSRSPSRWRAGLAVAPGVGRVSSLSSNLLAASPARERSISNDGYPVHPAQLR